MELVLTADNFGKEVLMSELPVLVDFWAPWCGPCRMMSPVVDEVAKDLRGKVKVGKLNVDENQSLAQQFNIMSIPTFLIFKEGKVVDQLVGGMAKEALRENLVKHI